MPATIQTTLATARDRLAAAGIGDPNLEAQVLLAYAINQPDAAGFNPRSPGAPVDRAWLFAHADEPLPPDAASRFDSCLARRLAREPAAYITSHREFYGLDFLVTPATLIPRPETEILVEAAIKLAGSMRLTDSDTDHPVIVDAGTGCGAIAIAIAHALPDAELYATDASAEALAVAQENARRLGCAGRIIFWHGDLLQPIPGPVDLVVANLPYVPTGVIPTLEPEVRDYEPHSALDGGPDGLDVIRRLIAQAPTCLREGGNLLLEFGAGQEDALMRLARDTFPRGMGHIRRDLAGHPRVLVVTV
jgi:release factor glutamine methyltransferase